MERIRCKVDDGCYVPERAHDADAGLDLRTPHEVFVPAGSSAVIDTGIHIQIPDGYVGMLKSKSGLNVKLNLVSEGVIDSGYTGSIVCKLYNLGKQGVQIGKGRKITQLVIMPIITPKIRLVKDLEETERGDNGFGSTGV